MRWQARARFAPPFSRSRSERDEGDDEGVGAGHRVLAVRVVPLLAHVQMGGSDAVRWVANPQACFAKLVRDSVVTTRFAHEKLGFNLGQGSPEGPHVLA